MAALSTGIRGYVRREGKRLLNFGAIGVASLGLNVGIYALISRVFWPSGSHTADYAITTVLVTAFNFEANRHFTFGRAGRTWGAVLRFGGVAAAALGLSNLLFWFGHAVLGWYDLVVVVGSVLVVSIFTFLSHRYFTFHPEPWRWVTRKG